MAQLHVLAEFIDVIAKNYSPLHSERVDVWRGPVHVGHLYCSPCGRPSKVSIHAAAKKPNLNPASPADFLKGLTPSVHLLYCLQCSTCFTALIFHGPLGTDLAIFSNKAGGLATKNTPKEVGYYLDQAWRCQSVGALSAAVVMYRSALEHLLHNQGYGEKTLAESIKKLDADIAAGNGPAWGHKAPRPLLDALRELGNGAVHTNDGDVSKQSTFDAGLLQVLSVVIQGLLEEVYESTERTNETLKQLQAAAQVFKKAK